MIQDRAHDLSRTIPRNTSYASVPELIRTAAIRKPEALAVRHGDRSLTYAELISRVCQLASQFQLSAALKPGSVIAVYTNDTVEMIVAALASWKSGCAYLPVDSEAPLERSLHMMQEVQAALIVANAAHVPILSPGQIPVMAVEPFTEMSSVATDKWFKQSWSEDWNARPGSAAYIIYTSGSSGVPKGVAISQGNLSNLISWYLDTFAVTERDCVSQIMALTFDASMVEIWPPLVAGATVQIAPRELLLEPVKLRDYFAHEEITLCEVPALVAEDLISLDWPKETKLRYMQTGGEALRIFPRADLPFKLVNNYGPTECSVVSTSVILNGNEVKTAAPSIGRPIAGVEVSVCDSNLMPVADGQCGEILVGGAGVGLGYVNNGKLSEERFIERQTPSGVRRYYRTGDLGKLLRNGEFEFCGRIDDQVKVRGYRIEPSEIARALEKHINVSDAVVCARGEGKERRLVAYIVLEALVPSRDLESFLLRSLPAYMIPSLFVQIDLIPMTPHGKIDFAALLALEASNALHPSDNANSIDHNHVDPSDEIRQELSVILHKILGRRIGLDDNFFRIGLNSLLAARVIANVQHAFAVNLPLATLFQSPTINKLCAELERRIVR